jgi:hypothetical protein
MRLPCLLGCSLAVFFLVAPARAADYYVSATGLDTNAGTLSMPWKTINKVNSRAFAAGDRIFFEGGKTFSGKIYLDAGDLGTAANPIVIGSYGTGRAIIAGGADSAFYAYNVAGIQIHNLQFTGSGASTSTKGGVVFYADLAGGVKLDKIHIDNVEVSGFAEGISIGSWNGTTGYRDVRVTNSLLHDNAKSGLGTYAFTNVTDAHQNVYVGRVKAYNQTGLAGNSNPTGNGIVLGGVDGGTIERCVAWNNGALNTNSAGPVGIWAYNANNIVIQYNEAYGNRTNAAAGGGDGGGFDLDGGVTNSVLQYNYAHDNDGAGYLFAQYNGAPTFANNTIRYNISQNDGRKAGYDGGINVWGYSSTYKVTNSHIYNNTVFMSPAAGGGTLKGIYLFGSYTGVTVRNNILVTTGGVRLVQADGSPTTASALFQGNDYWPSGGAFLIRWGSASYSTLAAFRTGASGQESRAGSPTGFNVDPKLTSPGGGGTLGNADDLATLTAYQLQSTSPMIDAALDLSSLFGINPGTKDYYGNTIPTTGGYDVGAHERPTSALAFLPADAPLAMALRP